MKSWCFGGLLLALCLSSRGAQAEIMVTSSLEWLADHCAESAMYEVTAVERREASLIYDLKLRLLQPFRGSSPATVKHVYSDHRPPGKRDPALVRKGDRFLVCARHYTEGGRHVEHAINLTRPALHGFDSIAATSRGKLLDDGDRILSLFKSRLASHTAEPVPVGDHSRDNRVELDFQSPIYKAIYSGSTCYLRVPADRLPE